MEISRNKWFGIVKWCDDDIAEKLIQMDIEPTPAHIAAVRSLCEDHHYFTDAMIETGWSVMEYLIDEAMENGQIVKTEKENQQIICPSCKRIIKPLDWDFDEDERVPLCPYCGQEINLPEGY